MWLVDDDPADHALVKHCLENIPVRVFTSAEQAIEAIEAGVVPNFVLLDIRMPGRGGFHFLEFLRTHCYRTPVVIWSSSRQPQDVARAYELGANAYLQKPNSLEKLVEMLGSMTEFWLRDVVLPEDR